MKPDYTKVKDLLSKAKIDQSLKELERIFIERKISTDTVDRIRVRLARLEEENAQGTMSSEDYSVGLNKIADAILTEIKLKEEPNYRIKKRNRVLVPGFGALVIIIATFFIFYPRFKHKRVIKKGVAEMVQSTDQLIISLDSLTHFNIGICENKIGYKNKYDSEFRKLEQAQKKILDYTTEISASLLKLPRYDYVVDTVNCPIKKEGNISLRDFEPYADCFEKMHIENIYSSNTGDDNSYLQQDFQSRNIVGKDTMIMIECRDPKKNARKTSEYEILRKTWRSILFSEHLRGIKADMTDKTNELRQPSVSCDQLELYKKRDKMIDAVNETKRFLKMVNIKLNG